MCRGARGGSPGPGVGQHDRVGVAEASPQQCLLGNPGSVIQVAAVALSRSFEGPPPKRILCDQETLLTAAPLPRKSSLVVHTWETGLSSCENTTLNVQPPTATAEEEGGASVNPEAGKGSVRLATAMAGSGGTGMTHAGLRLAGITIVAVEPGGANSPNSRTKRAASCTRGWEGVDQGKGVRQAGQGAGRQALIGIGHPTLLPPA